MQNDVGGMPAARSQGIESMVEHVRQPHDRYPESEIDVRERPADLGDREATLHVSVGGYIPFIIEIDEPEPGSPAEYNDDQHRQPEGDRPCDCPRGT